MSNARSGSLRPSLSKGLSKQVRLLQAESGGSGLHSYVNDAHGDESLEELFTASSHGGWGSSGI